MKTVTLDSVLQSAKQKVKTAEEDMATQEGGEPTEDQLAALLESMSASEEGVPEEDKMASVQEKLAAAASDAANQKLQNLVKEANFLGAAMADGMVTRLNQLDSASPNASEKVAAEVEQDIYQHAAELGYKEASLFIQKIAEEEYAAGEKEAEEYIEKLASQCYDIGHVHTLQLIANMKVD